MLVGIIQSTEGLNRIERQRMGELALFLSWGIHLLMPSDTSALFSEAFGFRLNHISGSWVSSLQTAHSGTSWPP